MKDRQGLCFEPNPSTRRWLCGETMTELHDLRGDVVMAEIMFPAIAGYAPTFRLGLELLSRRNHCDHDYHALLQVSNNFNFVQLRGEWIGIKNVRSFTSCDWTWSNQI
ncbi:hypothetical protein UA08_04090 [Talaromyces atroroseus]|uniref:Uncharacterized protein n=1 Tax=Talaromyces atroroseus TaxID=1441469 RepID=A0A1Q5Q9A1_TALAT|nr:hypothetical protein UA08_04090 [Talaromyces atroroseus]OKL60530.1 hypothetical protein UA08_04090 [Talaromyces atroroseus]